MTLTIDKGEFKSKPYLRQLALWHDKTVIEREVCFHASCRYDHPGTYDDEDVNKLFGIGYLWNHHQESARFGWNCNSLLGTIRVYTYTYVQGQREFKKICEVPTGKYFTMKIHVVTGGYNFLVFDKTTKILHGSEYIQHYHSKKWAYALTARFGGNLPAPHDMQIEVKKLQ